MKGFKKDGKFIPTGNKSKSSLKKSDVTRKVSTTSGKLRKKESLDGGNKIHNYLGIELDNLNDLINKVKIADNYQLQQLADYFGVEKNKDDIISEMEVSDDEYELAEYRRILGGVKLGRNKKSLDDEEDEDKTFKFDELSDDAKHNVRMEVEGMVGEDHYWAEDVGILYDNKGKFDVNDKIFNGEMPTHWDQDADWIQFELEVNDDNELRKWLGVTEDTWNKITPSFENEDGHNTKLEFLDDIGRDIDLEDDSEDVTKKEIKQVKKAKLKFDDLMDDALDNLKKNWEYQISDENIEEEIEERDWDFDEDGNII